MARPTDAELAEWHRTTDRKIRDLTDACFQLMNELRHQGDLVTSCRDQILELQRELGETRQVVGSLMSDEAAEILNRLLADGSNPKKAARIARLLAPGDPS